MRLKNISPIQLINLSFRVRFSIVALPFILCLIIYAIIFPITQNGTIIVIPVILAGWLFGSRGALICAFTINLLAIGITCLILRTIFWPPSLEITTLIGSIALFCIGLVIGFLRYTFTLAEISRLKAVQAERQRAIAYQQRFDALQEKQQMSVAYEHERQLNNLKDEFIINVNHEFRTPLTEVYGYLELLIEHDRELNDALRTTFLSKANDGCKELMLLVNTVLDSIQVSNEVKQPKIKDILLAQVVYEELALFDARKREIYAIDIVIADDLRVRADRQFLRQVLRNLISNAFKYSPEHTTITIKAHLGTTANEEDRASSTVCISVKDEGPGIPVAEGQLLFGKFVRLQRDLSGSIRGTGLGLYISKNLVESMKGRIWVESSGRAGEGSRFCFTLPHGSLSRSNTEEVFSGYRTPGRPQESAPTSQSDLVEAKPSGM